MHAARSVALATLAITLLAATPGRCAFVYDESIDGDLPFQNPLPVFDLEVGTNTFSGSISIRIPDPQRPTSAILDTDKFAFRIPDGTLLDALTMTFVDDEGDFIHSGWFLRSGVLPSGPATAPEFIEGFPVIPSPSVTNWTQVPLGPGVYNLATGGIGTTALASANYTIVFDVVVIPEPSCALVLGIAGAITSIGRRRRRHA